MACLSYWQDKNCAFADTICGTIYNGLNSLKNSDGSEGDGALLGGCSAVALDLLLVSPYSSQLALSSNPLISLRVPIIIASAVATGVIGATIGYSVQEAFKKVKTYWKGDSE
jgi:hypothetical protein